MNILLIYKDRTKYNNYRRHNVVSFFSKFDDVTSIDLMKGIHGIPEDLYFDTIFFEGPCIDNQAYGIVQDLGKPNCRVIFDRTDNWTANKPELEHWLLNNADVIINTSEWLYNDSLKHKQAKCYYIPSATNDTVYPHTNDKKIALYCGFNTKKVDQKKLQTLIDNNPDWQFISYGCMLFDMHDLELKLSIPYNECLQKMAEAKVGLIILNDSDWANGMLCLKTFDYIKEGLAVVTTSPNNTSDIPNLIQYTDTLKLNDIDFSKMTDKVPEKYKYSTTLNQIKEIVYAE